MNLLHILTLLELRLRVPPNFEVAGNLDIGISDILHSLLSGNRPISLKIRINLAKSGLAHEAEAIVLRERSPYGPKFHLEELCPFRATVALFMPRKY
ncbi:MAG: hypothetical protein BroJett011_39770 [Chloroflexota bacterium]|nr:MAG: hypothetical protein BroJett011_39770 [Chloroflexota bacterium]